MEAVIGVDPHKHVLSAVALDSRGGVGTVARGDLSSRGGGTSGVGRRARSPCGMGH
jgi:hypothetical protein